MTSLPSRCPAAARPAPDVPLAADHDQVGGLGDSRGEQRGKRERDSDRVAAGVRDPVRRADQFTMAGQLG